MPDDLEDRLPRLCGNGDGRPICPPSRVLCRACMDGIAYKLRAMIARLERPACIRCGDWHSGDGDVCARCDGG